MAIGAQALPLPVGGPDYAITDSLCVGLADYIAFWIRWGIGDRAIEQRPSLLQDPLPQGNVFTYDPKKTWARESAKLPALYVWWPEGQQSTWSQIGRALWIRARDIHIQYILAEVQWPHGARTYSGLTSAVDGAIATAFYEGYHPSYGYESAPLGTPIGISLGDVGIDYLGGQTLFAMVRPENSRTVARDTLIQRGYPIYVGKLRVRERLDRFDPGSEELTSLHAEIYVDEDPLLVLERDVEG